MTSLKQFLGLPGSTKFADLLNVPALLTAIGALDATNGVIVQTGAGSASKRAIGVASATDIPDRTAADGRYAQLGAANTITGKQIVIGSGAALPASTGMAAAASNTGGLEIQPQGAGGTAGAAFISFHRPGAYAFHLGQDTDGKLKVGGWSMGANAYEIWHAGNLPVSQSATAGAVAQRDGAGGLSVANISSSGASATLTLNATSGDGSFVMTATALANTYYREVQFIKPSSASNESRLYLRFHKRSDSTYRDVTFDAEAQTMNLFGSAVLKASDADAAGAANTIAKRAADSSLMAGAFRSTNGWGEVGSTAGGNGFLASNLYHDGTNWKTRATHASIGARALVLNGPAWGDVSIAEVNGATTANATVTPTFRTVWHSGNFDPATKAGLGSNTFSGQTIAMGAGTTLPASTSMSANGVTSSLMVQSQWSGADGATAGAAFMSFHRTGNYAVHLGLDTDNKLKVGGWSMGANAYEIWHAGNAPISADTATANTVAKRTGDGSLVGNHLYARTSDGSTNGTTIVAIGSNADLLDSYLQMNNSGNASLAGARSLNLVVNTGGFGLYTGRLSPVKVFVMDAATKVIDFAQRPTVGSVQVATVGDLTGAGSAITLGNAGRQTSLQGQVVVPPLTLADAGTVAPDFTQGNSFEWAVGGNRTLANPTGAKKGQSGRILLNWGGAYTLSLGSAWKPEGGTAPTWSSASGKADRLDWECVSESPLLIQFTVTKGFATS